jgi:hypothetical protein
LRIDKKNNKEQNKFTTQIGDSLALQSKEGLQSFLIHACVREVLGNERGIELETNVTDKRQKLLSVTGYGRRQK